MYVVIDRQQHRLLVELVESRIGELHNEIHRCRDYRFGDRLKQELAAWQSMQHRLHEAECDVTA